MTDEERLFTQAAVLTRAAQLEEGRLLAFTFAYACLSAAWSAEDNADASLALTVVGLLQPHFPG